MYRRSKKYQQLRARAAASVAARERKRLQTVSEEEIELDLPDLRKKIEITEFDSSEPKTTVIELYQSDRIDCYRGQQKTACYRKITGGFVFRSY